MSEIAQQAQGRWPLILAALGVEKQFLSKRNGPCPMCGGKDRYRFTDYQQKGMWYCSQCGTGDGFDLLMRVCKLSFAEAAAEVEKLIPGIPQQQKDAADERQKAADALNQLRTELVPAESVSEVARYLSLRGLIVPPGVQAHPALPYFDGGKEIGRFPAMVARVVLPSGKPATYHRTYVKDGKKAPVPSPKKLMKPVRSPRGGAIHLFPAGSTLGIAEGIETAIAAHMLFGIPVWSVVDAGGLEAFEPPAGTTDVVIFGDADESYTGQAAAYAAAKRLTLSPEYRKRGIRAEVMLPDRLGDWNDVLLRKGKAA